jgi:hypothetical protein
MAVLVLFGPLMGFGNRRLPLGFRHFTATGTIFLFVGMLIGHAGFQLLTDDVLAKMGPLLEILLGWLGFLYGSSFEIRQMRRFPFGFYRAALFESALTLAVVAASAWIILPRLLGHFETYDLILPVSLLLGICAAGTAPAGLFLLASEKNLKAEDLDLLKFFTAVDDALPIVFLGLLYAFSRPSGFEGSLPLAGWQWLCVVVGLGIITGLLAHRLFPKKGDVRENTLVLLGVVALGSGAAAVVGGSALFTCAVAGFVFANISTRKESAYGVLAHREHALYAVFLLIAGAVFRPRWDLVYIIIPGYVLLRAGTKIFGTFLGSRLFLRGVPSSPLLGAGLIFDGGLVLAIAVTFARTHSHQLVDVAMTTVVLAVIVNELIAPALTMAFLGEKKTVD